MYRGFGAEGSSDHSSSLLLFVGPLSTICMIQWSWQVNLPPPPIMYSPPEIRPELRETSCYTSFPYTSVIVCMFMVCWDYGGFMRHFPRKPQMDYTKRADFPSLSSQVFLKPTTENELGISVAQCNYVDIMDLHMFDMFCFHYQNQCATYEHAQKTLAFFRNNLLFHLAFCGLLWDSSQNDDGHFRFRSEHSACSMHLHLHKYTFETDTTYRIPTVYTCFYFLTHIYYKYIYIYYVAHVF